MITIKNKNIAAAVKGTVAKPKSAPAKTLEVVPVITHNEPLIIEVKDMKGNVLGTLNADYRVFSSGNKGYNISGRIPGANTDRLLVSGNVVILGSKNQ